MKISKSNTLEFGKALVYRAGFQIKKHSPEILMILGGIGVVISSVKACKATLKLPEITESAKVTVDEAKKMAADETVEDYTDEDCKNDIRIIGAKTTVEVAKLYAPSVILGSLSLGSMFVSNGILRKRNIALAAAYAVVDKGFKEYRERVIERFGEDTDKQLFYNLQPKIVKELVPDENDPTVMREVEKTVMEVNPNGLSEYSIVFDELNSKYYRDEALYNLNFLSEQQFEANRQLRMNKHMFLNEVYDMIGVPRTIAGQYVGWTYDPNSPLGDNQISFGIFSNDIYADMTESECKHEFLDRREPVILLDFNVDGDILRNKNGFFRHNAT